MATKRKTAAERRREAMEEVARENREFWGMTELDARILENTRRRSGGGVRDPRADERSASFWDACDCLFAPGDVLQRVAEREVNDLLATWASKPPIEIRNCSLLLLAKMANAIAAGGDHAAAVQRELAAKLEFLGEEIVVEVLEEMPPTTRLTLALVCAPSGFARDVVLARLPEDWRADGVAIYAGDRSVAARVLDRMIALVLG
ncbi:MAG: hypothetical protein M3619_19120 [Myxococcota bacterium]|nr:hypothetical protein [Myxococcota bacterium]